MFRRRHLGDMSDKTHIKKEGERNQLRTKRKSHVKSTDSVKRKYVRKNQKKKERTLKNKVKRKSYETNGITPTPTPKFSVINNIRLLL